MFLNSLINNGSFCLIPFIHQEKQFDGHHKICCYQNQQQSDDLTQTSHQSFNSKKINIIRKKMIEGIRPEECTGCYVQEDNGVMSARQIENKLWSRWTDTHPTLSKVFSAYENGDELSPISYDLRYSNTCTLKCRMCNSSSSSAINAEYKKINHKWAEKFWFVKNPRINHEIDLTSDIQKIYLAGGEPLIEPLNLELLSDIANINPNVNIFISTSLNIVNQNFVDVLNRFNNLTFVVSLDGVGKVNDYIRNGSSFDIVAENIEKFKHHNIMFGSTVSLYNIFSLRELVEYAYKKYPSFDHGINMVNDIPELYIENTPPELREDLISNLTTVLDWLPDNARARMGIDNILTTLKADNFDSNHFTNFIKYTKILDEERGESILDIQPILAPYFKYDTN
ncbi:Radical_SAM domain containing protein [uncultured Caudovirales phage]|uniref:Radical_SAM domain containing protein n=1 Tax=uncultured Caudovirales phage TaxID=2100421 RepID=A0A6J5LJ54_9CAUD|nr:Radical_SAM domain containing protein [uncultured Caudovirales phage]